MPDTFFQSEKIMTKDSGKVNYCNSMNFKGTTRLKLVINENKLRTF